MESVHGVDVSWLHRPQKDPIARARARAPSSPAPLSKDILASSSPLVGQSSLPSTPAAENHEFKELGRVATTPLPAPSSESPSLPTGTTVTHLEGNAPRPAGRRSNILNRSSSTSSDSGRGGRRASWISNISSRFSSAASPTPSSPATPQVSKPLVNGSHATSPQPDLERHTSPPSLSPNLTRRDSGELQPYVPQRPKESGGSFFSSITKRLAPSTQNVAGSRVPDNGGVCPRRTMNVNPNRARCLVAELDHSKLRRVSFSVDVEIASGPKYRDDDAPADKAKKNKDRKIKERAEGEALKHPKAATDLKEDGEGSHASMEEALASNDGYDPKDDQQSPDDKDPRVMTRKQEKKKKSEEERKERNQRKRKKAEENGTVPVELRGDDDDSKDSSRAGSFDQPPPQNPKPHDRPTTDPVRIYRRCCQLRESPILKRITEQLTSPNCTEPGDSGTVTCLNLTGSRLQLPDFITLGDWLAIVPVRRLLLEDADIMDEGLRVVLAGLLAAKKPEPTRVRNRNSPSSKQDPERAGVVEKLTLKNNPRITRIGWKHVSVFLNMCRSIRAIDLSMIIFPDDFPPVMHGKNVPQTPPLPALDAAEVFAKALAERAGGSKLEELGMSECELSADKIRRILDGAIMAGITRVGLAGNHLDERGFDHVLEYVRSGVCQAIDIGSNTFDRKQLAQLADALTHKPDIPVWGVSLASCDLDAHALAPLFPALVKLPSFRFLDISHNRRLFENEATEGVHLLRKYIPLLQNLKRLHLMDVGINAKQTIGLAEVLPEGPTLAHVSLLENAELSKLVTNTDESSQEEACALFASLMAAVRVSSTIICIDIDVPAPDNSEVVKALAKQVVAYCLRNMERMPLSDATAQAASDIAKPHTDEGSNEISYPDVLIHLVGHVDGLAENHDNDEPAPDDDYIVGGTGVVKALQYCLGEAKAQDVQRSHGVMSRTASGTGVGTSTPVDRDREVGREIERRGKAREMSKALLGSARKIRGRLQPALIKESSTGDELAYRRLMFLDQTLQGMIQRFEDEFPECRLALPAPNREGSMASSFNSAAFSDGPTVESSAAPIKGYGTEGDSDEDDVVKLSARPSRRGSEVSLASRALSKEEGRMHRLGHGIRQDILKASSPANGPSSPHGEEASTVEGGTSAAAGGSGEENKALDEAHLAELTERLEHLSGGEVRSILDETGSWTAIMDKVGASIQDLRLMQERDPHGWEKFVESQIAARENKGLSEKPGLWYARE